MSGPMAPPVAAAAGYNTLIFSDEFDQMPGINFGQNGPNKWNAGLWWVYPQPNPSCFSQADSALTITVQPGAASGGGGLNHVDLCTQFHDHTGGTQFLNGFFEARIRAWDWAAFWLFCWDRPWTAGSAVSPTNPMTWCNEIDILETDPQWGCSAWTTLHQNSSGDGGVADSQNQGVRARKLTNTPITGYWHNFSLLWTQTQLTWYIDDIPTQILAPYQSTNQPVQLILTAGAGGVGGSTASSPGQTNPPTIDVDYVRVWR